MTKEEFEQFIRGLHVKGWTDDNIVTMFAKMFHDKKISRNEFLGMLEALGYGLSEKLEKLSDDELREAVFKRK